MILESIIVPGDFFWSMPYCLIPNYINVLDMFEVRHLEFVLNPLIIDSYYLEYCY